MVTKLHRKCRCDDVLKSFSKNKMSFFTFTTKDVVTYSEIRQRWRNLRHFICEKYRDKDLKYVMNFELHPKGHGWHIHCVFNDFINLRRGGLHALRSYGFGMIRAEKVDSYGVAQYLAKHCLKAYRGVQQSLKGEGKRLRLVNCSRGLPRLSDYKWQSAFGDRVKGFYNSCSFSRVFRRLDFQRRYHLATLAVLNGWTYADLVRIIFSSSVLDLHKISGGRARASSSPSGVSVQGDFSWRFRPS